MTDLKTERKYIMSLEVITQYISEGCKFSDRHFRVNPSRTELVFEPSDVSRDPMMEKTIVTIN